MTVGAQVKQCLANLKSVKAGLEIFAAQSDDAYVEKELYEAASSFEKIIVDLGKRISDIEREEPQYRGF
ncbi:DUF1657 domain-containing protein [Pueribacillus sp. YX66]|uniref:DUF1657 domain-containing protein n=1 Tax=Pueribacillus sp. YX66 TaxID=3229242 RepID=UPI00358D6454